jgi:hypothetical protein
LENRTGAFSFEADIVLTPLVQSKKEMPTRKKKTRKPRQLKEDRIQIRVTREQRQKLEEAAERANLDLSSWLRSLALKAAEEEK